MAEAQLCAKEVELKLMTDCNLFVVCFMREELRGLSSSALLYIYYFLNNILSQLIFKETVNKINSQ